MKKLLVYLKDYKLESIVGPLFKLLEACFELIVPLLVADVIMNRVKSEDFPNTVTEVVWDNSDGVPQFSPTYDGRINEVAVSDETREAVKQALKGTDYSEGALFFIQKSAAEEHNVKWFEKDLKRLFKYGVHEFYTYK